MADTLVLESDRTDIAKAMDVKVPMPHRTDRGKPWAKKLTGIDPTQEGGYAFLGDFLEVRGNVTHRVWPGDVVATKCDDVNSRGRVYGSTWTVAVYGRDGEWDVRYQGGRPGVQALRELCETLPGVVAAQVDEDPHAALRAERVALIARLAEIDAVLTLTTASAS